VEHLATNQLIVFFILARGIGGRFRFGFLDE
jgi:hypothetical protein